MIFSVSSVGTVASALNLKILFPSSCMVLD